MNRAETIDRIRRREGAWDVIIIGGGATGVGCALDAASRGLDVLLLEQHDLGKGTSSRSTKIAHGGVRYLKQGNISLVREALRERGTMFGNAPELVSETDFVIPCYTMRHKVLYGVGLRVYELLAGKGRVGRSRVLTADEVIARSPNIERSGLKGGVLYRDGQFDDARLLIEIAQTARENGAVIVNYASVNAFSFDESGKIDGVEFTDVETAESLPAKARVVINATGAFCESLRRASDEEAEPIVTYSQGIHLVFDRKFHPSDTAIMIPKTSDGRVLFCIPWHGRLLIGTTDTPVDAPSLEPIAFQQEIDFVLSTAAGYLRESPTRADILSVWAGVRPLVKPVIETQTSSISRGHHLFVDGSGLITITGGKWTTYRQMAEGAVDKALEAAAMAPRPCITGRLPIRHRSPDRQGERLHPDFDYMTGDVIRAVNKEWGRTVEDVLARRTRMLFLDARAAIAAAPLVAKIMSEILETDEEWVKTQIRGFEATAQSYLGQ